MRNIKVLFAILVSLLFVFAEEQPVGAAAPTNPYVIVEAPLAIIPADTAVWIKWAGIDRTDLGFNGTISDYPDSGFIYVSKNPGGSNLSNYIKLDPSEYLESNVQSLKEDVNVRGIKFTPSFQPQLEPGAWYLVVGFPIDTLYKDTTIGVAPFTKDTTIAIPVDTAFVSNEIPFIVKHSEVPSLVSPTGDTLDEVTPTFKWNTINGVPYYHIVVSDDEIVIDSSNGDEISLEGVSIIWQAITPASEITYGAPDPSGTITATPPPLSPGQTYTWLVLNNYGNNIAMTAPDIPLPGTFTIAGEELLKPVNVSPITDTVGGVEIVDTFSTDSIQLKWTNLDPNANTYKVYLYKRVEEGGLEVQLAVWDQEYLASKFTGDTASIKIDAKSSLVTNYYTWRVVAVDKQGKGSAGKYSKFFYDVPTGSIKIWTKEKLSTGGELGISFVELDVEVLEGSLENILFVTDHNGYFFRERSPGRLKVTANKDGYKSATKYIDVIEDSLQTITFYLERPEATIYGKVTDNDGLAVNLAQVKAISDKGDTAKAETDPNGNYVLNCYEDNWNVTVSLTGYTSPSALRIALGAGVNYQVSSPLILSKNSYVISGKVLNEDGAPVVAAMVQLFNNEGDELDKIESTPSSGFYSFSVNSGTYKLKASKTGFLSGTATLTDVTSLIEKNLTLTTGSLLLQGTIYQKSWNNSGLAVVAAITDLKIDVVDETTGDTVETGYSDDHYGSYAISVPKIADPTKYHLYYSKTGLQSGDGYISLDAGSGDYLLIDTIATFASLSGVVQQSGTTTPVGEVTISLIDQGRASIYASAKSDALGELNIFNLDDVAKLTVTAGGGGYIKDSVISIDFTGAEALVDTLSIVEGRVLNGTTPVKSLVVKVKEGTGSLSWSVTAVASDSTLAKATVKIKSPVSEQLNNGDTLLNAGPGEYLVSASVANDSLIDLAEQTFVFSDADAVLPDTVFSYAISLPLYHKAIDTTTAVGGVISLVLRSNAVLTADSVILYYKDVASAKYTALATATKSENDYSFTVTPPKSGSTLLYYFVVKLSDGTKYGISQETFQTFIKPDATIVTKLTSIPAVDTTSAFVIPLNSALYFDLKGYYGDNFTEISSLRSQNFTWRVVNAANQVVTNATVVPNAVGQAPGANVTGALAGTGLYVEAVFDAAGAGVTLKSGVSGTIRIPITVLNQEVDSLLVRISGSKPISGFYLNSNEIQLLFDAYTKEGTKVNISPAWSIKPEAAGTITAGGILTTLPNFSGPLEIYAAVNDSMIATYRDGTQKGIYIGYQVSATGGTFTDFNGISVTIPANAVATGESVELCIKRPIIENNLFKSIPQSGVSVASKIFEIQKFSDKFRTDSVSDGRARYIPAEQVKATIEIPEMYEKYVKGDITDTISFSVGLWEEDSISWDYLWKEDSTEQDSSLSFQDFAKGLVYEPTSRSFSFPIGEVLNRDNKSRVAVLYRDSAALYANVIVSPNPFSPYVSPLEDYKDLNGMHSDIMGTCIKITPMNKTGLDVPKVDVNIYTAAGTLVWAANLNVTIPGQVYYLFWDGRTRIDRADITEIITVEPGVPIVPKGDNMCRNGRYFAVVTVDDGSEIEHYTKEIILFK